MTDGEEIEGQRQRARLLIPQMADGGILQRELTFPDDVEPMIRHLGLGYTIAHGDAVLILKGLQTINEKLDRLLPP